MIGKSSGVRWLLALLWLALSGPLVAAERMALVIGNSAYEHAPHLANPANDARGVAAALRRLNFEVIEGYDRNHEQMRRLVQTFANRALSAEVALVYYAGHGAQVSGSNYLLPVDSRLDNVINLTYETLQLDDDLLQPLAHGAPVRIVILDACRDNPLAKNLARSMPRGRSVPVGRGLGRKDKVTEGTLIAYATQPDNIALDVGGGGHSPFTAVLLNHIETPGLEIGLLIRRVRGEVWENTRQKQRPWDNSDLIGEFYFKPGVAEPAPVPPPPDDKPAQVTALLEVCEQYLGLNWLTTGSAGENETALACYRQVLGLAPGNTQALQGLETMTQRYIGWAEGALGRGDRATAAQYVEGLARVSPEHPQLETLRGQLTVASVVPEPAPVPAPEPAPRRSWEPEMMELPGGEFWMGSPASEAGRDSDEKRHPVRVAPFAIGKYEVTFEEYDRFAEATGRAKPDDAGWGRGNRPVINVSWDDAIAYAGWLSAQTGKAYRLPTEAEWEYAARAGTTTAYSFGETINPSQANYDGVHGRTVPVGQYPGNAWGIHDMHGNVWEWTCSEYDENYGGAEKACISKNRAKNGARLVLRGGSCYDRPARVRAADRFRYTRADRDDTLGFRLARSL